MSKKLISYFIQPFIGIASLFVLLLYIQNGTTLTVQISSPNNAPQRTIIYYAHKKNQAFSEQRAIKPFKVDGITYSFTLPNLKDIAKLRFDPTTQASTKISFQNLTIIEHNWLQTRYYRFSQGSIQPTYQIKNFQQNSAHGVTFESAGNDPQLAIILSKLAQTNYTSFHIDLLFASIIFYLFALFFIYLYKNKQTISTAKIILYALFFALTLFKTIYYKNHVRVGYPPDETVHLSYIEYVHHHHQFITDFEHMNNYLSHPPLYYELANLAYNPTLSLRENADNFRVVSLAVYMLAFILILYLGYRANFTILGDFAFLSLLVSVPMHAYIGASVSNDPLAILGGALFVLGFWRLIEKRYDTPTYTLLSLGIFVSYFSKLTAAILVFFALVFYLIYLFKTKQKIEIKKVHIAILVLAIAPALYYQAYIMLHYHALVPTYNVTHHEAYLHSGFYTPEQYRAHLNPTQWFERMIHYIKSGWFGIHSHHSFGHPDAIGYVGLLTLHIFALLAMLFLCQKTETTSSSHCIVGKITLLSVLAVLVVQYIFSYKAHLNSGYLGGLQPRYLLPFLFSFAIMAGIFVDRFSKYFIFSIAVILISVQSIYSDFFYFLQYYK